MSVVAISSGPWGLPEGIDTSCILSWTTKTLTPEPRLGNSGDALLECREGILNRYGMPNRGIKRFLDEYEYFGVPTIVSIAGFDVEDISRLSRKLDKLEGIIGIELNVSCPNVHGMDAIPHVKSELPVSVKLSPCTVNLRQRLTRIGGCGIDSIVLSNSIPILKDGVRWAMSGAPLKAISLRCVMDASEMTPLPIIGCGGITTGKDVQEYIEAGATSVQVGSIHLNEPDATTRITAEYMDLTSRA
jgi:dihydroorotate dehydrogenase (NAD+) catalytic subunit